MKPDFARLKKLFGPLPDALLEEFVQEGVVEYIPKGTELLREGQFVKVVPIVLSGLLKVYSSYEDKELLLYYLEPNDSCIMSFASSLMHNSSSIYAVTEEDSELLLLPARKIENWTRQYPQFNQLIFQMYHQRYTELLNTIHQLLFEKLDSRVFDYLTEKARVRQTPYLDIRHWQIANELGSSREVISRILKKLQEEGKIKQLSDGIKVLKTGD